jgi:hypothetical protein
MINIFPLWSSPAHRLSRRLTTAAWIVGTAFIIWAAGAEARADVTFNVEHPSAASIQMEEQHVAQLFQEKLKDIRPEAVEAAKREFLDYLRRGSPVASEQLLSGKMDEEELESRVAVYLRDHPALTGVPARNEITDPRKQVAGLLHRESVLAKTDAERLALADRFLEKLGQRSPTARDDLLRGKMNADELQSRINVFVADLRAEAAATPIDPKAAEVVALVESFVKANFSERANDIVYRIEIDANGVKREGVVFRKRPNKVRMHIVQNGLVMGALAFDGQNAWRQEPGKAGVPATGAEADALKDLARFDDPLVDYREHGTEVKLGEKIENGLLPLNIRERDGTEMVALIDPATYNEVSLRTRQSDGTWKELRFSDYRKVGALNLAYVQEDWSEGKLRSTTRVTEARLDTGLIDEFFVRPINPVFSYMDYMGGLAAIKAQQSQSPPFLKQPAGGVR